MKFNGLSQTKDIKIKCSNIFKNKSGEFAAFLNDVVFGAKVPFFENELRRGNAFLTHLKIQAIGVKESDLRSDDVPTIWLSELTALKTEVGRSVIDSANSRLTSRYIDSENIFTHLILDSSTTGTDSALDYWLKNDPRAPSAFKVHVNSWNVTEGMGKYFNFGSFEVYCGDSKNNPFIIPKDFPEHKRRELDPDNFLTCPNELLPEAQRNIVLFLQEKAGISTNTTSKFFRDKDKVSQAFCLAKDYDDVVVMRFDDPTDTLMSKLSNAVAQLPYDRKLYIRIDCGVASDLFGLAIGYGDGIKRTNVDGVPTERIKIKIPIAVGISRYEGEETNISKVEDFILQLNQDREVALVMTDQYQCLTGDTEIICNEGRFRIDEIVKCYSNGDKLSSYSYDLKTKTHYLNEISAAWRTGVKDVYEVYLSNGKTFRCTDDHRLLLKNGEYKEVKDIEEGTQLQETIAYKPVKFMGYEYVGKEEVYDLMMEKDPNFSLACGIVVHNSTELRQIMKQNGIEAKMESVDRDDSAYVVTKNYIYSGLVEIAQNALAEKELLEIERVGPRKVDHPPKSQGGCFTGDTEVLVYNNFELSTVKISEIDKLNDARVITYDDSTKGPVFSKVKGSGITKMVKEILVIELNNSEIIKCTPDHKFLTKNRGWVNAIDLYENDRLGLSGSLHVVAKGLMSLVEEIPVYDLEVDNPNHNFVLACGAVVHNSKDISDTISGVVRKLVELGPEVVLEPPSAQMSAEFTRVYDEINDYHSHRQIASHYSDYL